MAEDFSELIEYLDQKFGEINGKVDGLRTDFNILQKSVEEVASTTKVNNDEIKSLHHRADKTDTWINDASSHLGLTYKH